MLFEYGDDLAPSLPAQSLALLAQDELANPGRSVS